MEGLRDDSEVSVLVPRKGSRVWVTYSDVPRLYVYLPNPDQVDGSLPCLTVSSLLEGYRHPYVPLRSGSQPSLRPFPSS